MLNAGPSGSDFGKLGTRIDIKVFFGRFTRSWLVVVHAAELCP